MACAEELDVFIEPLLKSPRRHELSPLGQPLDVNLEGIPDDEVGMPEEANGPQLPSVCLLVEKDGYTWSYADCHYRGRIPMTR